MEEVVSNPASVEEIGEGQGRHTKQRRHKGKVTQCRTARCLGHLLVGGHGWSTHGAVATPWLEASLESQAQEFGLSLEGLGGH